MESKRKTRKVLKVVSAPQKSVTPPKEKVKPEQLNPDVLIRQNGELIEDLFASKPWTEIAFPLLQESIASVSGRLTNGRYWHGTLTSNWKENTSVFIAGYQKALMDFQNNLHDFIVKKDEIVSKNKAEQEEKNAPLINPFMENVELED